MSLNRDVMLFIILLAFYSASGLANNNFNQEKELFENKLRSQREIFFPIPNRIPTLKPIQRPATSVRGSDEFCLTKSCIREAIDITERINQNVDPCYDFYEFACGSASTNINVPRDRNYITDIILLAVNHLITQSVINTDSKNMRKANEDYKLCLHTGINQAGNHQLWKICTEEATAKLPTIAERNVTREILRKVRYSPISYIVSYVHNSYNNILKSAGMITPATRMGILKKSNRIKFIPAFSILEKNRCSAYPNTSFGYDEPTFAKLKTVEDMKAFVCYIKRGNVIVISAGAHQGVHFQPDRPDYLNFGGIGNIIAQGIGYAFDPKLLAEEGIINTFINVQQLHEFKKKIECLQTQYNFFTKKETKHSSIQQIMADNEGVKIAYEAYQNWIRDQGIESKLPGLNYTPNQLFWIAVGQNKCVSRSNNNKTFPGSESNRFRVNGPLINSKEFAADWKCGGLALMNPYNKCGVL